MKAILKTFTSGIGDCISFRIKDEQSEWNMLIDCGSLTTEIENYIHVILNKHINLLVVTHIDNDHILGLKEILMKYPDLKIDRIFYNCCQQTPCKERACLSSDVKNLVEKKKEQFIKKPPIKGKEEIGAKDALSLAELILGNPDWQKAWIYDNNSSYITNEVPIFPINNGLYGELIFLSPTKEAIDKLDKVFRETFDKKFYSLLENDVKEQEMLFEMLLAYIDTNDEIDKVKIGSYKLTKDLLEEAAIEPLKGISVSNMSSLAFLWRKGEHSVLFMGDASPNVVAKSLKIKNVYNKYPYIVDAIKVSHHGSKENMTNELLEVVDSEHYFFTGGCNNSRCQRPSLSAIARILLKSKVFGSKQRCLHFNFISDTVELLQKSSDELKKEFNFIIDTDCKDYEIQL